MQTKGAFARPVTIIDDWNLTVAEFACYRGLISPDMACLRESQTRMIAKRVKNTGGLIMTLEASL